MSSAENKKSATVTLPEEQNPMGVGSDGTGNVDKIRDILFGSQMRDYEKRFLRLEERLQKESMDLRDDLKKRFDSLENFIRSEVEALSDRAKTEQQERSEAFKVLSQELKETARAFEKKIVQLDEQSGRNQRDIRQQLLDQSKSLTEDIRDKYDRLSIVMERSVQDLSAEKVDRASLAAFLTEVAMRLTNEFKIAGVEGLQDE